MAHADDDIRALQRSLADPAAFQPIFDRHHGAVRRYLRARIGEPALAEDLAAETFARAFAARRRFRDEGHGVKAWLFTIATNLLRDELRARGRRGKLLERLPGSAPDAAAPSLPADPELAAALTALRREELEVLLLHAWADLSYEEIAIATGVPIGTVRSRLSRARAQLRNALPDHERSLA